MSEYRLTTQDLADEFQVAKITIRRKAKLLGIGINRKGRAGFLYSEADRLRLIESMKPDAPVTPRRKRRAA